MHLKKNLLKIHSPFLLGEYWFGEKAQHAQASIRRVIRNNLGTILCFKDITKFCKSLLTHTTDLLEAKGYPVHFTQQSRSIRVFEVSERSLLRRQLRAVELKQDRKIGMLSFTLDKEHFILLVRRRVVSTEVMKQGLVFCLTVLGGAGSRAGNNVRRRLSNVSTDVRREKNGEWKTIMNKVVKVYSSGNGTRTFKGNGIIVRIDSKAVYILTSGHLLEALPHIWIGMQFDEHAIEIDAGVKKTMWSKSRKEGLALLAVRTVLVPDFEVVTPMTNIDLAFRLYPNRARRAVHAVANEETRLLKVKIKKLLYRQAGPKEYWPDYHILSQRNEGELGSPVFSEAGALIGIVARSASENLKRIGTAVIGAQTIQKFLDEAVRNNRFNDELVSRVPEELSWSSVGKNEEGLRSPVGLTSGKVRQLRRDFVKFYRSNCSVSSCTRFEKEYNREADVSCQLLIDLLRDEILRFPDVTGRYVQTIHSVARLLGAKGDLKAAEVLASGCFRVLQSMNHSRFVEGLCDIEKRAQVRICVLCLRHRGIFYVVRVPHRNRRRDRFRQSLAYVSVLLSGRKLAAAHRAANLVKNATVETHLAAKPSWRNKLNALVIVRTYDITHSERAYWDSHGFVVGYDEKNVFILATGHGCRRKRRLSVVMKDGPSEAEIPAVVIKKMNRRKAKLDISLLSVRRALFSGIRKLEPLRLVCPLRVLPSRRRHTVYQLIWRTKRVIVRSVTYTGVDGASPKENGFWIPTAVLDGDSGSPVLDPGGNVIGMIVSGTKDETYALKAHAIRGFLELCLPECTNSAMVSKDERRGRGEKGTRKCGGSVNLLTAICAGIMFLPGLSRGSTGADEGLFDTEITFDPFLDFVLGYPLIVGGTLITVLLALLLYLGLTNRLGRDMEKTLSEEDAEKNKKLEDGYPEDSANLPLYGKPIPWTGKNRTRMKTIGFSGFLGEQIERSIANGAVEQRHVLVYRDAKNKGWIAGGLIEIATRNRLRAIHFVKDPETEPHRLPEQFIRRVIGRHNPQRIVFLTNLKGFPSPKPSVEGNDRRFIRAVLKKFNVLLPNYNETPIPEDRLKTAKHIFNVSDQDHLSYGYEYGKVHLWRQVQYYLASLRSNRVYRRNALFWFLCSYLDEMLHGLFIAMIFITAENMGVLSIYNVFLYIMPVFVVLFAWPPIARIETNLVRLRRDRRSSEDDESYWDRKVQNHEAFVRIKRYIRIYGCTYILILVLFFLTIHPNRLEQGWGSSLTVRLTPSLFLGIFLVWHMVEEIAGQFISEIMAEIDAGEIYYSDNGVKRGFASIGDSLSTAEGVFNQLFMIASFMIGYGVYHVGLYDIMVPLFFAVGLGGVACWFAYPLFFGEDLDVCLEIEQSVFLPGSRDNSLWLSDNVEMTFAPRDERLENIEPIHVREGKTVLPWGRDLGVTLRYKERPEILERRRLWIFRYVEIHGVAGDPPIIIQQQMRSVSETDLRVTKNGDHYEIAFRTRAK